MVTTTTAAATTVSESGVDQEQCWVCLGGVEDGELVCPCKCPRHVHLRCLARWQLQCSSRSSREETTCRFCSQPLPPWEGTLANVLQLKPVSPVLAVRYEGRTFRFKVPPGPEGKLELQRRVKALIGIDIAATTNFDVTFECSVPTTGEKVRMTGMGSYNAALACASLAAAQRRCRPTSPAASAGAEATTNAPPNAPAQADGITELASAAAASAAAAVPVLPPLPSTPSPRVPSAGLLASRAASSTMLSPRPAEPRPCTTPCPPPRRSNDLQSETTTPLLQRRQQQPQGRQSNDGVAAGQGEQQTHHSNRVYQGVLGTQLQAQHLHQPVGIMSSAPTAAPEQAPQQLQPQLVLPPIGRSAHHLQLSPRSLALQQANKVCGGPLQALRWATQRAARLMSCRKADAEA